MSESDTTPLLQSAGEYNPCGCSKHNGLRRAIIRLTDWDGFDGFVLVVIVANTVMMMASSPLDDPTTPKALLMGKLELVFNLIFTVELFLKVTALGLKQYVSSGWNLLDVTVVGTSWAPYVSKHAGNYSFLRAVRVLRALRTVSRIQSLRQVVKTLLKSLEKLTDVSVLFGFFLFLFGIIGVNLFSGKLHRRCTDPGAAVWVDDFAICDTSEDCDGSQTCEYYEANPAEGALSYDNCLHAFVTIFQAVTLEGWVDQMYILGVSTDPVTATVYYILVVIFGAMFIVNLFLAVIFEAFIENKPDDMENQEHAVTNLVISNWEYIIYLLIVGNTISMCITHDGQSEQTTQILELTNYFFTTVFALEMALKLGSRGIRSYFSSGWNTFDFLVTWASIIDLVLDFFDIDAPLLRALRVARIMRLLRLNEDMRRFEKTAAKVAGHVINLSGVLILIIIVAAMLGMELFGGKLGDAVERPRTHFDYFKDAFVTVFVVASGENWNDVFADTLTAGSTVTSVLYFIPLFIIGNYVLVNLFVAIICWGWESSIDEVEVDKGSEEEKARVRHDRLTLQHNLSKLRSQNAELLLQLQELIDERTLGFSAQAGSKLMARMGSIFKDFEHATDQVSSEALGTVAGVTLGFASLVTGLTDLLDNPEATNASGETKLLFEYWDSEHARTSGAASAFGPSEKLHNFIKRYITTITANRVFMGHVVTLQKKLRAERVQRVRSEIDASGAAPVTTVVRISGDPEGAEFLPLTLDGDYGVCLRQLRSFVTHPTFDNVVIFCILCSSLSLAFDMPSVQEGSSTAHTLELLDYTFTALFVIEMILKLLVYGPFAAPDAYFRSGWNILDATIVTTSLISLLARDVKGLGVFRALRALRTLRPLRVIQRFKSLKKVVNSLFRAVPAVINVSQICGLIVIVYGLFGMQFLKGRMQECNDPTKMIKADCVGTFTTEDGETTPRWWGNDDIGNFDNIFYAALTLFEMSTLEMWPDVMFRAMDANPEERGVAVDIGSSQNPWMALYIISWIIVSAFFLLNLFVGVVLENFNAISQQEDGSGLMDEDQKEWSKTLQNVLAVRAERQVKPPGGKTGFAKVRKGIFMLVQGDKENKSLPIAFEKFIISLVLLNVLSMALTWYGQPKYMDDFADIADVFFTAAFTLEMILKITGLGLRQYLHSYWNVFDGTLVSGSLIADLLQGLATVGIMVDPATLRMLRIFRIARLLRLIRVGGDINRLINTIVISIPALGNVGILLFLFLYIYTILGIEMFHKLPLTGDFINEDANFAAFGTAMLTLFRCITGESYNGIMHDAMITEARSAPGRCSDEEGTCGNPLIAVPFFISFVVLEAMVMLNLIVAVVLDTFSEEEKSTLMHLSTNQIESFVEAWKDVDPEATHFMATKDLKKVLMELDPPMGFKGVADLKPNMVTDRLRELEIPDRASGVAFHEVLEAIGKHLMPKRTDEHGNLVEIQLPPGSDGVKLITRQYGEVFKSTGLHKTTVSQYSSAYIYAVIRMQNAIRKKLSRKRNAGDAYKSKPKSNAFTDKARKQAAAAAAQPAAAAASTGGSPTVSVPPPSVSVPPPPATAQRAQPPASRQTAPPSSSGRKGAPKKGRGR